MSFFQLQTIKSPNFEDRFMLNQVEIMSYFSGTLTIRFKSGSSERYTVSQEISEKVISDWESWCASQSAKGVSHLLEETINDLSVSFQDIMSEVDKQFKQDMNVRVSQTLDHVDALFKKLAPRYEALEKIAATFEKFLGDGVDKK